MSSTSGRLTPPSSTTRTKLPPRQSKLAADLAKARDRGAVECSLPAHFKLEYFDAPGQPGVKWSRVVRKDLAVLYESMLPGESAKCDCLKRACEAQWGRNFHGRYVTQAIAPGSYTKGLENSSTTPKSVFSVPYALNTDQFKALAGDFPEKHFVSRTRATHDHPISHTSMRIAGERVLDSLARGTVAEPRVYLDLYGNPGSCEAYMQRHPGIVIVCVVECVTPRDYVRCATKWGPEFRPDGTRRWWSCSLFGLLDHATLSTMHFDGIVSIHTAYYFKNWHISRVLAHYKCPMYCLMHRFTGNAGSLNHGEQTYIVRNGQVEQVNTLTKEKYNHPNNDMWFNNDCFIDGVDGVAWDSHLITPSIFKFIGVWCPAWSCMQSPNCYKPETTSVRIATELAKPRKIIASNSAMSQKDIAEKLQVVVDVGRAKYVVDIRPQLVAYFGEMRNAVVHRARTAQQFQDHVSRCRVRAKSVMSDLGIDMDPQELADLSACSFFIDMNDQHGIASVLMGESVGQVLAADQMYKNGGMSITRGTFNALCTILLAASDGKDVKQAAVKSARAGLSILQQYKVV